MREPCHQRPSETAPTLLIFTRGAERERAQRRLLPARLGQLELALHRRGLEAAIRAGKAAGCRIVVSSPTPLALPAGVEALTQRGRHLGERLRAAIDETFETYSSSGGPLLVVGTDAPGLSVAHLQSALAALRIDPDTVVLGPATDGGFYLLGASRPVSQELGSTSWCRDDTLLSLRQQLDLHERPCLLLDPLTDLDRPSDLATWLEVAGRRVRSAAILEWWPLIQVLRRALAALVRLETPLRIGSPRLSAVVVASGRSPPYAR